MEDLVQDALDTARDLRRMMSRLSNEEIIARRPWDWTYEDTIRVLEETKKNNG